MFASAGMRRKEVAIPGHGNTGRKGSAELKRINQVSERALIARINRKLSASGWERLRTSRGAQMEQNVGRHYILDLSHDVVIQTHVNIENLARELGTMTELENLAR